MFQEGTRKARNKTTTATTEATTTKTKKNQI